MDLLELHDGTTLKWLSGPDTLFFLCVLEGSGIELVAKLAGKLTLGCAPLPLPLHKAGT